MEEKTKDEFKELIIQAIAFLCIIGVLTGIFVGFYELQKSYEFHHNMETSEKFPTYLNKPVLLHRTEIDHSHISTAVTKCVITGVELGDDWEYFFVSEPDQLIMDNKFIEDVYQGCREEYWKTRGEYIITAMRYNKGIPVIITKEDGKFVVKKIDR